MATCNQCDQPVAGSRISFMEEGISFCLNHGLPLCATHGKERLIGLHNKYHGFIKSDRGRPLVDWEMYSTAQEDQRPEMLVLLTATGLLAVDTKPGWVMIVGTKIVSPSDARAPLVFVREEDVRAFARTRSEEHLHICFIGRVISVE